MSTTTTIVPQNPISGLPLNLQNVGDSLFSQGYLISVRNSLTLWIEKEDGETYILNPRMDSCTCPAGQRGIECKHKRGTMDLVFLSADFWFSIGEGVAAKDLIDWWGDYTSEVSH